MTTSVETPLIRHQLRNLVEKYVHTHRHATFIICNPDLFSTICGEEAFRMRDKCPTINVFFVVKSKYPADRFEPTMVAKFRELSHRADRHIFLTQTLTAKKTLELLFHICGTCFLYCPPKYTFSHPDETFTVNIYQDVQAGMAEHLRQFAQQKVKLSETIAKISSKIQLADPGRSLDIHHEIYELAYLNEQWEKLLQ